MEILVELLEHEVVWRLEGSGGPEDDATPPERPSGKLSPADKRMRTILLVEDEQEVRAALLEGLAEEGYGVTAVRNGVEAIRVLTYGQRLPDLILLDLMMPVMDGWEFQRRVEANPKWRDIPIVIYSANTRVKPIRATVVLAKPCTLEQLVAAISAHVK